MQPFDIALRFNASRSTCFRSSVPEAFSAADGAAMMNSVDSRDPSANPASAALPLCSMLRHFVLAPAGRLRSRPFSAGLSTLVLLAKPPCAGPKSDSP